MLNVDDFIKALNKDQPASKSASSTTERQRLDIQRQRLELQRQRLEFEKEKHNQRQTKSNAISGAECIIYLISTLLSFGTLFILIFILTKILKY